MMSKVLPPDDGVTPGRGIQSAQQVREWILVGQTYSDISDLHLEHYGNALGSGTLAMFRQRQGIPPRWERHDATIPWKVKLEHRYMAPALYLRQEGRRLLGKKFQSEEVARGLEEWKARLKEEGLVVHYDGETEEGFFLVPARPGVDTGLIRIPDEQLESGRNG